LAIEIFGNVRRVFEAFLETTFQYFCRCSSRFLQTFSALVTRYPVGTLLIAERWESWLAKRPDNMADAPKVSHVLRKVILTTNDHCAGALICTRNHAFPDHHENVYATRTIRFCKHS
jgi:hypothetical protein